MRRWWRYVAAVAFVLVVAGPSLAAWWLLLRL